MDEVERDYDLLFRALSKRLVDYLIENKEELDDEDQHVLAVLSERIQTMPVDRLEALLA